MESKWKEFERAWPMLAASAIGAGIGVAPLAFYSLGAFVDPLVREFGWSRAQITASLGFLTVATFLVGAAVGALADRQGARKVALISQVALVLALAAMSLLTTQIWTLYAGYFLLAILGAGTLPIIWSRPIINWFKKSRGLALGLSLVATGVVGALLPSYVNWLTASVGWRGAYLGLAALPLLLGIPVVLWLFREPSSSPIQLSTRATAEYEQPSHQDYTLAEALTTWRFWQMSLAFLLAAGAISAVLVHSMPLLTDRGIDRGTAAAMTGLLGLAVTAGRLASGYFLDVCGAPKVAFVLFATPALACMLLTLAGDSLFLCGLCIFIVGLAGGAEYDIAAYLTADYFGQRHYGAIYGLVYTMYGLSSGFSPLIAGAVFDATGSYTGALYAGSAVFLAAAILAGTLRETRRPVLVET